MFSLLRKFIFLFLLVLPASLVLVGNGEWLNLAWFAVYVNRKSGYSFCVSYVLWCFRHLEWSYRCEGINSLNEAFREMPSVSKVFYFCCRCVSRLLLHSLRSWKNGSCFPSLWANDFPLFCLRTGYQIAIKAIASSSWIVETMQMVHFLFYTNLIFFLPPCIRGIKLLGHEKMCV